MSTSSNGFWSLTVGEREASLQALEKAIFHAGGSPKRVMSRLRADPTFAKRLGEVASLSAPASAIDVQEARGILGANIFGLEEWLSFFHIDWKTHMSKAVLAELEGLPWSKATLEGPCPFEEGRQIRDTHFAFLGFPTIWHNAHHKSRFSLVQWMWDGTAAGWQGRNPNRPLTERIRSYSQDSSFYEGLEMTSREACRLQWYLMPLRGPKEGSALHDTSPIPGSYTRGRVIEEVTKLLLAERKTGVAHAAKSTFACEDSYTGEDGARYQGLVAVLDEDHHPILVSGGSATTRHFGSEQQGWRHYISVWRKPETI